MSTRTQLTSSVTKRRPSDATRAKAQAAKAAGKQHRINNLRALLLEIDLKLTSGTLRKEEVTHEWIRREAELSHATYYRYLGSDAELRCKAEALTGTGALPNDSSDEPGSRLTPPGGVERPHATETLADQLKAEIAGKGRLTAININLMQQLALCKALLGAVELDLRAKTREVWSKDLLLAGERSVILKLATKLKELAEFCHQNGLEVDLELATLLERSPEALKQTDSDAGIKLNVIQGGHPAD